ncbi:IS1182 family transposase [Collimonas pratensis]|uniref:Transposase DDE domain protein n=1 Tax=Collimonas pratensis TaxID=279113 RepID=A0A127Q0L4_9BURK|nr:IS1182 family transposase [Collimonas pratensis]AMP03172.1 transposase DDE domain protein [Collimonas pratensis]AMP05746.1 transposase DDE domain protein [Collimonas pratensis]AMP05809.1 transposase DDE domain protein [Collimonas pratensis]AMP06351.1 transposase DDE domain protein [Collimonas pratensis]
MKRFVQGTDRTQSILLPEQLEDYVSEDNPVRVIDVFVDSLDLGSLGFGGAKPAQTGRPSYHPSVLLKIYIYGYLNRVQSSRRLEREAQRNIEVMWLTSRLMPDFKTIADFRKNNGPAISKVCRQFVLMCRNLDLFANTDIAIDGSKFKAVNNRDKNFTDRKLQARIEQLEANIARYLEELDRADRQPELVPEARVSHLKEKIASIKKQIEGFNEINKQLQQTPDKQISLTDPDARSMATSGRGTGMVGYNVQTAVDTRNHLIVSHEVTNVGHDRTQLASMAAQAQNAIGKQDLTVVADRGYFSGAEILACEKLGVTPLVPKPLTSGNRAQGLFDKTDFIYLAQSDEYQCPAGQRAIWRFTTIEHGLRWHKYWSSACPACPIKAQCTTGTNRRIARWEHEDVLERMQRRLNVWPNPARLRRQTVEHPFGTLKAWMGATHFLTRSLPRVSTEMSLHVLAYNLKRIMAILGTHRLIAAMRA